MKTEICPKCSKYKTCKSPCYPVWQYLAEDNLSVFEKTVTKENGEKVSIIFARSREQQQSMLSIGVDKQGDPRYSTREQQAFSTETENPFASFNPRLKQTGIFIDRFFHKASYDDLAFKYDVSKGAAVKIYYAATQKLRQVIETMDDPQKIRNFEHWKKQVEERSGHMPKGQRWFLLNKLFGLRPSEIAEMEGLDKKNSSVRQLIIRVSDQLKAGEISLIEITPEEAKAAKARLETHKAKRRKCYAFKRAKN
jgi:DNA-directed RNA polymerase specialized sigma24 family protein